ncbi:MAG: winged helix-turn-helix domain-containing protein [Pseudobdellovibrio sp.]
MSMTEAARLFEIGKLYCDRGDYALALPNLKEAIELSLIDKNHAQYLKCIQSLLRIHAEREEFDEITKIKENLHDLVIREGTELTSKTYYVLGLCSSYKGQPENAVEYLKKALSMALEKDSKEDMCYAILGLAICYKQLKKYDEALKELYNLDIFLQVLNIPELKASSANTNALILLDLKRYEQALEVLWIAYEELKNTKQLTLAIGVLGNLGVILFEMGQKDAAKVYLNLAFKSLDPANNKHSLSKLSKYLIQLDSESRGSADLVFDLENHSVMEKNVGKIDFKNQFILLDLLKLFIGNQGHVFSKEYLVEHVWKQNYDPEVHDNKIYVTIKRLRKLIEPDYDKPKYIFRAKNGYYLNKSTKIQMIENRAEGAL